ncbi:MAG TPA: glycosyltransferase family 2 protein [Solirubrobacterales bacterium]|nr:glycosyltransferase family 2 protein [Solirubrobacterales bacterium]
MSALVKVIVPCYGYGELLEGCLESVLGQEGVDVRVLVADDCSPDDTPTVARRVAKRDPRVEYTRHKRNEGLIATANEGLEWAACSDYVVLLSADDLLVPGSLWRAVSTMKAHPEVGMAYGRAPYFRSGRPLPRYGRWRGTEVWPGAEWIRRRCQSAHNCISSPEVVVRTSVQMQAGPYDPACTHASDLNMWLRIASISDVAYVKGTAQALYRVDPESMQRSMRSAEDGTMTDLTERRVAFEHGLAGAPLPQAAELRATARRRLARQALWQASRAYDRGEVDGPGARPVEELIAFAFETYPEARQLREWRGLRLRQRIGAGRSLWFPPFLATGAAHRLHGHARKLRWRLHGV